MVEVGHGFILFVPFVLKTPLSYKASYRSAITFVRHSLVPRFAKLERQREMQKKRPPSLAHAPCKSRSWSYVAVHEVGHHYLGVLN